MKRQQPAENAPAAAPRWILVSALVPFIKQEACGLYTAGANSQVLWFIGVISSVFVDSCFWSYWSCWQHLLSPWMDWDTEHFRAMLGLMAVHVKASPYTCRGQDHRGESLLPSQVLLLGSCTLSGEMLLRCQQGAIHHAWPAPGHTGGLWQHMESELDHWWLFCFSFVGILCSCWLQPLLQIWVFKNGCCIATGGWRWCLVIDTDCEQTAYGTCVLSITSVRHPCSALITQKETVDQIFIFKAYNSWESNNISMKS